MEETHHLSLSLFFFSLPRPVCPSIMSVEAPARYRCSRPWLTSFVRLRPFLLTILTGR